MEKTDIQRKLFSMQDETYRAFQAKLMPTIDPERVIGVRTPLLRSFAKEFCKTSEAEIFMQQLPHTYYEENNLHAFLLEREKDFDTVIRKLDAFLPYVDNWATCDTMTPKVLSKHKQELLPHIDRWIKSGETYTVRYAIGLLMGLYLDDAFDPEYPEIVSRVQSEEYYVRMMVAWYFATALAKQYDEVLPYITENRLPLWTHNKTIQKAVESYRITPEQKAFLRSFRRSS